MSPLPSSIGPPLVVFGGTGFVGRHLLRAAALQHESVILVTRGAAPADTGATVLRGDLGRPGVFAASLPKGCVVVNLAHDSRGTHDTNMALAEGLIQVCVATGAERLVHVSTAMVAGLVSDVLVTEASPCRPVTAYQHTKLAVEECLREGTLRVCPGIVLRPTAVFGAGGMNLRKLVSDLTSRPLYENYLRACLFGKRPMNLVPVETVASAVLFAVRSSQAILDGLYLVSDDEAPENNFGDVETILRRELSLRAYPIAPVGLPAAVLAGVLRASGRLSFDPRTRFSSARIRAAGFEPPVAFREALGRYGEGVRQRVPGEVN